MNSGIAIIRYRSQVNAFDYIILLLSILVVSITSHYIQTVELIKPAAAMRDARSVHDNKVTDATVETIEVITVIPDIANANIKEQVIDEKRTLMTLEEEVMGDMEQERIAAIKEYINSIVCDPLDVSKVSNLKAEDFKLLTKGTWWEGNEQALIDLEQNHHINAMFAMSVSSLESGRGTSPRALTKKNFYGMEIGRGFYSLYDCTQYWGKLISEKYVGQLEKESVYEIGPTYCPPNRDWENFMDTTMHSFYNSLINNMETTLI